MTYEELKSKVTSQYDCCTLWVETQKDGEYVKECAKISRASEHTYEPSALADLTERYTKTENARLRVVNGEGVTRYEVKKGIFIGTGKDELL